MKVLGIESSSLTASVAIWEDEVIVAEYTVNFKKTHSQTLLPMLDEIVRMTQTDLDTVDAIAISAGPGSFTGLRIGSATAKGIGLALHKPLAEVSTIEAMALQAVGCAYLICPIMDARRNQVYTGVYEYIEGKLFELLAPCACDLEQLAVWLSEYDRGVLFIGDGIPVYKEQICKLMNQPVYFAPAVMNRQRAAAVAELGAQYVREGKLTEASAHRPEYLRKPQAEREMEEKLLKAEEYDSN
jgi:tRNA threonylcarbamoyladenosine biosynthesis protein TsaB